jgi:hypothetical protein
VASPRRQRDYKRKFPATITREVGAGNPAIMAVLLELQATRPAYRLATGPGEGAGKEGVAASANGIILLFPRLCLR